MSGSTANLGLYLPGGGSTGLYGDDEVIDIDKINGNSNIIDSAYGDMTDTLATVATEVGGAYNPVSNPITTGTIVDILSADSPVPAALVGSGSDIVAAQEAIGIFVGPTAPTNVAGVIWLQTSS